MLRIDSHQHFWSYDPEKFDLIISKNEQELFFGGNAIKFYNLN